jgi:DNA recombination protein RmuC
MTNIYLILLILILLSLIVIALKIFTGVKVDGDPEAAIKYKLDNFSTEILRIEASVKTEISTNRTETNETLRNVRIELSSSLKSFEEKLSALTSTIDSKLLFFNESIISSSKDNRTEIKDALESFKTDFSKSLSDFNSAQKDNFFALLSKQSEQNNNTSTRLDLLDMQNYWSTQKNYFGAFLAKGPIQSTDFRCGAFCFICGF